MILDTNAVSAILEGDEAMAAVISGSDRHHLPAIVLGEYRFGLVASRRAKILETLLSKLEAESFVLAIGSTTARHYARVRHELRVSGKPIPENDIWIAALAREHNLALVSRDSHFDRVSGIRRVSW